MTKTPIPGNKYSERDIWADMTKVYLEGELRRIVGAQQANKRGNARYVAYVRKLKAAIANAN